MTRAEEKEVLAVQEIKLTYCFYENPAAKQEIKFWESLVEDKIKTKTFTGDHWGYLLEKDFEYEFVCCIHLQDIKRGFEPSEVVENIFKLHRKNEFEMLVYNKTLIFGKVELSQLQYITRKMTIWEK